MNLWWENSTYEEEKKKKKKKKIRRTQRERDGMFLFYCLDWTVNCLSLKVKQNLLTIY
jgi:hypothetical protein